MTAIKMEDAIALIKDKCKKQNYKFSGFVDNKWNGNATKLKLKCDKHNFTWSPSLKSFKIDKAGCKFCGVERRSKLNMTSEDVGVKNVINKCEEKGYTYKGYIPPWNGKLTKLKLFCPKEGHGDWNTTIYDSFVNSNKGCPECGKDISRNSRRFDEKTAKINIENKCKEKGYTFLGFVGDKYINNMTKLVISCPKHGKWDKATYNSLISKKQGCPICNESKGSIKISNFLEKHGFTHINQSEYQSIKKQELTKKYFIREYSYDDCRSNITTFNKKRSRKLPFDFFLPNYNLCLEYDGEQHFIPKFGKKENDKGFLMQQENDKIKNEYCTGENDKPSLLRIDYKNYNNIETILSEKLKI